LADINVNVQIGHTGYQTFQPPVSVTTPWTLRQSTSLDAPSDVAISATFPAPVLAGNFIIVACRLNGARVNPPTIADSRGNGYTQLLQQDISGSFASPANHQFLVWVAYAVAGGSTTITVSHSDIVNQRMIILEYGSGGLPVELDVQQWVTNEGADNGGVAVGTVLDSGATGLRTAASELLVALVTEVANTNVTLTPGTNVGWTLREHPVEKCFALDAVVSSVGTQAIQGTFASSVISWASLLLSFRQGGAIVGTGGTIAFPVPTEKMKVTHATPIRSLSANTGTTIAISDPQLLQSTIDAHLGDPPNSPVTFLLPPGVYPWIYLRPRTTVDPRASALLTIKSTGAIPSSGVRIGPTASAQCARFDGAINNPSYSNIWSSTGSYPLYAPPGTHNWQFIGCEFLYNAALASGGRSLCEIGNDSETDPLNAPNNLTFDRCLINIPEGAGFSVRKGITTNCAAITVKNCYIAGVKYNSDTCAVGGWNGPGPFTIDNNYLSSSSQVIFFGGADCRGIPMQPGNLTLTRNYMTKNPAWRGVWLSSKNIVELKNMLGATVTGNLMENSWNGNPGQNGRVFTISPRNQGNTNPYAQVRDVLVEYNVLRNGGQAFDVMGYDYTNGSAITTNVTIRNNLAYNIGNTIGATTQSMFLSMEHKPSGLYVYNNTHQTSIPQDTWGALFNLAQQGGVLEAATDLQVHDNVLVLGTYSMAADVGAGNVFGATGWNASVAGTSYFNNNICQRKLNATNYTLPGTGNAKTASDEVAVDPVTFRVLDRWLDPTQTPAGIPGVGCNIDALDANNPNWP